MFKAYIEFIRSLLTSIPLTIFDYIVLAIYGIYVFEDISFGLIPSAISFVSTVVSFFIGLSVYPFVSKLITASFSIPKGISDAFSMGVGNVLSILADRDVYNTQKDKELHEIKNNREDELAETIFILKKQGFSDEDANKMANLYSKNENYWAEFMMRYELEMPSTENDNPLYKGIATICSFIFFGFIPLVPYVILINENKFLTSIIFAFFALVLLGVLRWKVTTQTLIRAVGEIVILGGIAAVIAYFVGTLFK